MVQAGKVVAIIQARMGSTRLPGKVLQDIGGATMLARVVRRTQRAALVDEVVVATTHSRADDAVVAECQRLRVPVFRGSEDDVLDRYYQAAKAFGAGAVVRITSDCPLIDPGVVDRVIRAFVDGGVDYASNTLERRYPRGLDTEVMSSEALARAWRAAKNPYQRTHVTPYIYQNPGLFRLLSVVEQQGYGDHRWTVDTVEDLKFVRAVYARLPNSDSFTWQDVLKVLEQEPGLAELNSHIRQKSLEDG